MAIRAVRVLFLDEKSGEQAVAGELALSDLKSPASEVVLRPGRSKTLIGNLLYEGASVSPGEAAKANELTRKHGHTVTIRNEYMQARYCP